MGNQNENKDKKTKKTPTIPQKHKAQVKVILKKQRADWNKQAVAANIPKDIRDKVSARMTAAINE